MAILSLLTLAPAAARPETLHLSGDLRGGYSRSDSGGDAVLDTTSASWAGGGRLSLSGSPFRPGLADLLVSGDYNDFRSIYDTGESRSRVLGLRSSASLLGGTVLPLHLDFSRSYTEFLADLAEDRTGRSVITSLGGGAVLRAKDRPMLSATVSRTEVDNTAPDGSASTSATTRLALGASQSVGTHRYSLAYDTGWDRGTFAQNNYRSHQMLVDYAGSVDTTLFHLTERYHLREPTVSDPTNFRSDDNSLATGIQWRALRDGNASLGYGYRRATLEASGVPEMELSSHSATQRLSVPRGPNVRVQGQLSASYGYERRGDLERRAAAEAVGLDVNWSRVREQVSLYAGAGSSVGLVHPAGEDLTTSLGASASGGVRASGLRFSPAATYSIAYQRRAADLTGWSLQQRLDVSGDGVLRGLYLRAMLALSDLRREDDILGESEIRSGTLLLSASGRRSSAQLSVGASDSLGPGFATPAQAEGLIAPSELDTRTVFGTLTASTFRWNGRLTLSATARTLDIVAPGRPETWEHGLSAIASLVIGRVVWSLEDRVSLARAGEGSRYANLVFTSLSRSFGARIR